MGNGLEWRADNTLRDNLNDALDAMTTEFGAGTKLDENTDATVSDVIQGVKLYMNTVGEISLSTPSSILHTLRQALSAKTPELKAGYMLNLALILLRLSDVNSTREPSEA